MTAQGHPGTYARMCASPHVRKPNCQGVLAVTLAAAVRAEALDA